MVKEELDSHQSDSMKDFINIFCVQGKKMNSQEYPK